MTTRKHDRSNILVVDEAEPLSTLVTIKDGREVVISASSDSDSDITAQNAMSVFGAWSDIDWDEAAAALDRIRHESAPTPPIDE